MQADPIGHAGGRNLYAYVGNDPLNLTDRNGQAAESAAGIGLSVLTHDPSVEAFGTAFAGVAAYGVGIATGNDYLANAAAAGLRETRSQNIELAIMLAGTGRGGVNEGAPTGGRLGSAGTRALNSRIATELESNGNAIVGGGGRAAEEYIPGSGPGTRGSTYVDITAKNIETGSVTRVQTIDTYANGQPTSREAAAAARIEAAFPEDTLILIPKK